MGIYQNTEKQSPRELTKTSGPEAFFTTFLLYYERMTKAVYHLPACKSEILAKPRKKAQGGRE